MIFRCFRSLFSWTFLGFCLYTTSVHGQVVANLKLIEKEVIKDWESDFENALD